MGRGNRAIGIAGERIALEFLKRNGYEILETNYRTPFGEIDIIAMHGDSTVFIEVKTRATCSLGPPYLAVTRKKQRHMIRSALSYLKIQGLMDSNCRFDVVSIRLDYNYDVLDIELIENAVEG
jgi:putative endonuclease